MRTVNIHEAKTHLSRFVELRPGEPFVIAKAGKPLVKVVAMDATAGEELRRTGFMIGEIEIPDDFNEMGRAEIEQLFASQA